MKGSMPPDNDNDEPPTYCPPLSLSPPSTPDWDNMTNMCWTCSILCCCFPLCYPCYLSKTARKMNKWKKQPSYNSQARKRNEKGQKDYRRSEPLSTDKARVTSTMNSEQSTGTSGYGTLLSRKGTLVSVLPNVDPTQIQEAFFKKVENNSRKDISALFLATEAAATFLNDCLISDLLQKLPPTEPKKSTADKIFEEVMDEGKNDSSQFDLSFNSTFNFSQSCLLQFEDSSCEHQDAFPILPTSYGFDIEKDDSVFDSDLDTIESLKLFENCGHVDVSVSNIAARVNVTAEIVPPNMASLDHVQEVANIYCRQLVKSDLLVLIVREEDGAQFRRRGLVNYISKYWAGFFPVLLVEVGTKDKERDILLDTLSKVFLDVERLSLSDNDQVAGEVFSAMARLVGKRGIGGIN